MNTLPDVTIVETTAMRRAVGRRMSQSKREVPHFYVSAEADVRAALAEIAVAERASGQRVTLTAALAHACSRALVEHPSFNAVWTDEGLAQVNAVNIGLAIALPDGLIAPALLAAHRLDLLETANALADLVERAGAGRLRPAELSDATFTVSNLGMFGVTSFAGIVTQPQVAILAAGMVRRLPRYEADEIVPMDVMELTISADHRAVDGADAAKFLKTVVRSLSSGSSQATSEEG